MSTKGTTTEPKPRRPRSSRPNGKLHQAALSTTAAAIVQPQLYAALPEGARKAQRLVWQQLLEARMGCADKVARRYIADALAPRQIRNVDNDQ